MELWRCTLQMWMLTLISQRLYHTLELWRRFTSELKGSLFIQG
jgi:hypothetical protein